MAPDGSDSPPRQWTLGPGHVWYLLLLGGVTTAFGAAVFGQLAGGGDLRITISTAPGESGVLPLVMLGVGMALATLALFVVHEWCHGLAFRWAGAQPKYGAKLLMWFFPVLYASAPGTWLTRRQYLAVILAPTVIVNAVGVLVLLALPGGLWVAGPLAFHLGGCVGDWWMAVVISRPPAGTLFEDTREGFRFRPGADPLSWPTDMNKNEDPGPA